MNLWSIAAAAASLKPQQPHLFVHFYTSLFRLSFGLPSDQSKAMPLFCSITVGSLHSKQFSLRLKLGLHLKGQLTARIKMQSPKLSIWKLSLSAWSMASSDTKKKKIQCHILYRLFNLELFENISIYM